MVPDAHLLKLLFPTRYTSRSIYLLAMQKRLFGLLPYFLCSREIYRSSQQQFSRAQRAQRKFRVEPGRSAAKLALCKEFMLK